MPDDTEDETEPRPRDRGITVILIAIWITGLLYVVKTQPEIPHSMLIIGSIFFIVLVPAMKDLVRSIERRIGRRNEC